MKHYLPTRVFLKLAPPRIQERASLQPRWIIERMDRTVRLVMLSWMFLLAASLCAAIWIAPSFSPFATILITAIAMVSWRSSGMGATEFEFDFLIRSQARARSSAWVNALEQNLCKDRAWQADLASVLADPQFIVDLQARELESNTPCPPLKQPLAGCRWFSVPGAGAIINP